jgi:hypothetical protein
MAKLLAGRWVLGGIVAWTFAACSSERPDAVASDGPVSSVRPSTSGTTSATTPSAVGARSLSTPADAERIVKTISQMALDKYAAEQKNLGNAATLCPPAEPVPEEVPKGTAYTPSSKANADFQTVMNNRNGWRCLGFELTEPMRYRLTYTVAGVSFEVIAEGDLDGDGVTSKFRQTALLGTDDVLQLGEIEIENRDE